MSNQTDYKDLISQGQMIAEAIEDVSPLSRDDGACVSDLCYVIEEMSSELDTERKENSRLRQENERLKQDIACWGDAQEGIDSLFKDAIKTVNSLRGVADQLCRIKGYSDERDRIRRLCVSVGVESVNPHGNTVPVGTMVEQLVQKLKAAQEDRR